MHGTHHLHKAAQFAAPSIGFIGTLSLQLLSKPAAINPLSYSVATFANTFRWRIFHPSVFSNAVYGIDPEHRFSQVRSPKFSITAHFPPNSGRGGNGRNQSSWEIPHYAITRKSWIIFPYRSPESHFYTGILGLCLAGRDFCLTGEIGFIFAENNFPPKLSPSRVSLVQLESIESSIRRYREGVLCTYVR